MRFPGRHRGKAGPEPESPRPSAPPQSAAEWHALGNERSVARDWAGATEAYRKADELGDGRASADYGLLREYAGDLKEAEKAYRRADERDDALGALRLGILLGRRGDWSAAGEAYRRADQRERGADDFDLGELVRERIMVGVGAGPTPVPARQGALVNPVLIGAVTTLLVLIGVFLAYNSNAGLPFVPTKEVKVDIADGANLVTGNDVREGGYHIGLISAITPKRLSNGRVVAELTLNLSERYGSVPVDSRVTVLSRSALGLKYVDLIRGRSARKHADGGTLPIAQTSVPVQIDQVFGMFNPPTRTAIQKDLTGFGDTFTGRGSAINDLLHSLPPLLGNLKPVAQYLADPATGLTRFLTSADRLVQTIAPVSPTLARLFTDMGTTFQAISGDPNALEQTIAKSPSTLAVSTDSLKTQQPLLDDLTTLGHALAPATADLKSALPVINPAIEAGTRTLVRTPPLNAKLQGVMRALKALALTPGTNMALNGLVATVDTLNPMIRYLGPYQTVCDNFNYFWTSLADNVSEATAFGTAQRLLGKFGNPLQQNNVGTPGATMMANGGGTDSLLGGNEYLHVQNYGAAIAQNGLADCEVGQRGSPRMLNHFDPKQRMLVTDSHTPGLQGPTYRGRARVPAGETFSRNPTTGPQLPENPTNP